MTEWNTLRCFNRHRFAVSLQWSFANDFDLSWADDITKAKVRSGALEVYTFRVVVLLDGCIVGADYLGESIYDDPAAFAREHYGIRPLGRLHDVTYCVYFPDMVRTACAEARKAIRNAPRVRAA